MKRESKRLFSLGGHQYVQIPGVPRPVMTCHARPIFTNQVSPIRTKWLRRKSVIKRKQGEFFVSNGTELFVRIFVRFFFHEVCVHLG